MRPSDSPRHRRPGSGQGSAAPRGKQSSRDDHLMTGFRAGVRRVQDSDAPGPRRASCTPGCVPAWPFGTPCPKSKAAGKPFPAAPLLPSTFYLQLSFSTRFLITFAGLPPTTVHGSTFFVTRTSCPCSRTRQQDSNYIPISCQESPESTIPSQKVREHRHSERYQSMTGTVDHPLANQRRATGAKGLLGHAHLRRDIG